MSGIIAVRKGWNWFAESIYEKRRDQKNLNWMNEMRSDLKDVVKEVKPNGGESIRDAVDRVDRRTEYMEKRLAEVENKKADK